MASAVALRDDFTATKMRALARLSGDANQVRRLLALATICEGGTRSDAAQLGGVGLQTVRDWVLRFNAAGPD
ncbi:MAG: helix-turn-helix domain-containing protein, partial [Sphingomonas sp.]